MSVEIKVPEVGESITEVEIGEWQKSAGDAVNRDDVLVMIETDKVTVELAAPTSGTIKEILKNEGDTAQVGEVIGYLEEGDGPTAEKSDGKKKPEAKSTAPKKDAPKGKASGDKRVMPSAQRVLHEKGASADDVQGTGPGGRVLKEDAQAFGGKGGATGGPRHEEVVPMTSLRKMVAKRLVQAQQEAALLTTFNEIDMSAVIALRKQFKEAYIDRHEIKLGFMSFFVKATVEALKENPAVNAEIRGTDVVYKNYYDIGVAVGGGKGLVVPVLRNAERQSFAEVERSIYDFAVRAKSGKLKLDELQGGTFTISNGGVYGSMMSTPIVNPPQSGILGLHAIQDRAVAVEGQVVVRPMMYVALTYDHRIIDGREAVTFLKRIKECIENPSRILLEI